MSLNDLVHVYLGLLHQAFLFDYWVFSQWWLYVPLLIPAVLYFMFFCVKWMVLSAPVWIPLKLILESVNELRRPRSRSGSSDTAAPPADDGGSYVGHNPRPTYDPPPPPASPPRPPWNR